MKPDKVSKSLNYTFGTLKPLSSFFRHRVFVAPTMHDIKKFKLGKKEMVFQRQNKFKDCVGEIKDVAEISHILNSPIENVIYTCIAFSAGQK